MQTDAIKVIAFDADDTLWVNEPNFREAENGFEAILGRYLPKQEIADKLYETEKRNLKTFGYGAKGFIVSMIETALELTDFALSGKEVQEIIDLGRKLLAKPIELLDEVEHVLDSLDEDYELMLLTKGDLFEQESKFARSGLAKYFHHVEIVSEKDPQTYRSLLERHQLAPHEIVMIGNSLRSDILPMREIGVAAIHIPYHTTWVHEQVQASETKEKDYLVLSQISELLKLFPTPNRLR
ncbi:MAG: HAD family hydrolase [Bacteroidota bacterium]